MENNEITMCMDVKVDKRPEITRYQQWTRSQVKIEAVKCLPCFLRITLTEVGDDENQSFTLLINIPGVTITLCSSRTKQYSYALCWTQNRKNCFIYFALDTESSCRRHMKWVKKSIKNLELHRKLLLEERRCSRGAFTALQQSTIDELKDDSLWSQRVSEIYEEIYEPQLESPARRVSRRTSRTSIASGIYEEMRFPNDSPSSFNAINEELLTTPVAPTPPPLPPLRKRFNTYETEEVPSSPLAVGPLVRCNTNPETDLAKKKKYKNIMDTIFHGGHGLRSKRAVSTSDGSSQEQLATTSTKQSKIVSKPKPTKVMSPTLPKLEPAPIYANDDTMAAKLKKKVKQSETAFGDAHSKRNSFSSPDLSKINFVDTFDEQRIAEMLNPSFLKCDDFDLANSISLDESVLLLPAAKAGKASNKVLTSHRQNISTQLPFNFNFSACNTSSVNLVASLTTQQQVEKQAQPTKNKIIHDDLTGYCVMAPIVKKMTAIDNTPLPSSSAVVVKPLEILSSGYSTGSHSSSTSSTEDQKAANRIKQQIDESVVYMNMEEPREVATPPLQVADFTGNLYENLLAIKAARELEPESLSVNTALSTSTPTESPLLPEPLGMETKTTPISTKIIITNEKAEMLVEEEEKEESFYQTPRRSIISIDDKIPSYYPNSCESSSKSRRRSYSPAKAYHKNLGVEKTTPTTSVVEKSPAPTNSASSSGSQLRQLVSSKLRRERKENLFLTPSPQGVFSEEQRKVIKGHSSSTTNSSAKISRSAKKAAALKISENVYAVKHRLKKSVATDTKHSKNQQPHNHNNNNIESELKITEDQFDVLEHLEILRKIDFKFEDTNNVTKSPTAAAAQRMPLSPSHHLQVNQSANTCHKLKAASIGTSPMTQSVISASVANSPQSPTTTTSAGVGGKKFASLPRFKKFDLSPLRMRINNVLQRNQVPDL